MSSGSLLVTPLTVPVDHLGGRPSGAPLLGSSAPRAALSANDEAASRVTHHPNGGHDVIEGIPAEFFDNVGAVGLVVLFGIALAKGWIVTSRELAAVRKDRDDWHAAANRKDEQIAEKDEQLGHLKHVGEAVERVMSAIQRGPVKEREEPQ